ncbi:hypothetical protein QBC34DRAFT_375569 [Podospora aff. communis PSN243]|uniref:Uncharacterized protein n=1 Tax=Podospora aff. communis PSN243 TaxID=3040156 RepID=A0AAV9H0U7_9PEZI|nr:hypothetical protein QBC34DRAFT_375569 [Podospora aff. communis PSN243]
MSSLSIEPTRIHSLDGPPSPSPRSTSLQAAATLNAGLQREQPSRRSSSSSLSRTLRSPSTGRRRSQVLMNLSIADPSVPAPGEMVSEGRSPHLSASPQPLPQHFRAPSLGELHQELENEQEFQVNRLLSEIRRLQQQVQQQQSSGSAIGDDSAPPSAHPISGSLPRSPSFPHRPRSSFDIARADLSRRSRTPSRGASPRMRAPSAASIGETNEQMILGGRDESAFYQAETQMLIRENQMLKHRIRELEKQLSEAVGGASPHPSLLHHSTSASEEEPQRRSEP